MRWTFPSVLLVLSLCCVTGREADDLLAPPPGPLPPHTFEYRVPAGAERPKSVHLAGDFNGWSNTATPMKDGDGNGVYRADVPLPEGVHLYKFVVNGDQWQPDPAGDAALEQPDNFGGQNSGVLVGPDGRKLPKPEAGRILAAAIRHDPKRLEDQNVVSDGLVRLALIAQAGDVPQASVLVRAPDENDWRPVPLAPSSERFGIGRIGGLVQADATKSVQYVFELKDGPAAAYVSANGVYGSLASAQAAPFTADLRVTFRTPDWAKHAVWYQIFPERFRNGEPANDPPKTYKWQSNWWSELPGETKGMYKEVWFRRFGGDLQGVREKLPYFRSLGINAIYFNPIFEAVESHKYDTADYRHIDDNFGFKGDIAELQGETDDPATWKWSKTDRLFLDFVEEAHRQGFKVILDGVFNHVGREHHAFQDVVKNGKASKYADWFEITDFGPPLKYKAWDGDNGMLPVFKKDAARGLAPGPREHVMAITKRWLAPDGDPSKGIDGWRLDVPGDIPHPFWVEFRQVVKSTKPDAYICGEIWQLAQPWLKGDQFDATMNYPFATLSREFFADRKSAIAPSAVASRLAGLTDAYPFQVALVQQNLLDSHDTDRFASMFVNPDLPYDRYNRLQDPDGTNYSPAQPTPEHLTRLKQALVLQFTYAGAPMVYYGDEAGMWSPDDPSNRMPMVWQDLEPYDDPAVKFNPDIFSHYQRLIALRNTMRPLRLGLYRTLLADDAAGVLAFARDLAGAHAYVVINRSDRERDVKVPLGPGANGTALINWLDDAQIAQPAPDAPEGRATLKPREGARRWTPNAEVIELRLPAYGSAVLAPPPN
jgi:cyclomaltodextrinase